MRLSPLQLKALKHALEEIPNSEVYLFGSRTDRQQRGGDVDILIVLQNDTPPFPIMLSVTKKYQQICDEKIDVVVYPHPALQTPVQQEFFKSIHKIKIQ